MTPETKLDLSAIEARCAAATPGPWNVINFGEEAVVAASRMGHHLLRVVHPAYAADGKFIAHARTDVPALVAEVERLRARELQPGTFVRCRCGSAFPPKKQTGMCVEEHTCPGCRRAETAEDQSARLTADLAECYRLTGADPDGNDDAMLAGKAVDAVRRLRAESEHQFARAEEFAEEAKGLREIVALALEALRCTDAHDAAWEAYETKRRAHNYYQDDPVLEFDRDERTKDWPETATALRTGEARGAALDARDAALRTLLAKGGA